MVMRGSAGGIPVFGELPQRDHIALVTVAGTLAQLFRKEPSFYFAALPQMCGQFESAFKVIEKECVEIGAKRNPRVGFDFPTLRTMPRLSKKVAKIAAEKRGWEYVVTRTSIAPADVTTQVLQVKSFG